MLRLAQCISDEKSQRPVHLAEALMFVSVDWTALDTEMSESSGPALINYERALTADNYQPKARAFLLAAFNVYRMTVASVGAELSTERLLTMTQRTIQLDQFCRSGEDSNTDQLGPLLLLVVQVFGQRHLQDAVTQDGCLDGLLTVFNDSFVKLDDNELMGWIPLLLIWGMPLCFNGAEFDLLLSSLWERSDVRPLVFRCWNIMARVLSEHTDRQLATLPKELIQSHIVLYAGTLNKCSDIVEALDNELADNLNKNELRRLFACCRTLCESVLSLCRFGENYASVTCMLRDLLRIRYPLLGRETAGINYRMFREEFLDLAVEVLDSDLKLNVDPMALNVDCPLASPFLRKVAPIAALIFECLDNNVIETHDVPYMSYVLRSTGFLPSLTSSVDIKQVLTRMQSTLSLLFSRRAWSYVGMGATTGFPTFPSSLIIPGDDSRPDFTWREDAVVPALMALARLHTFWHSVEANKLQNESITWMPISPIGDQEKWSAFQQRMSQAGPELWQAHRDNSVHAWMHSDTVMLTCPFEYYRRNWLRHMHAMSALPFDESSDSNNLSFLTELSTHTRCVATYLSRALIERCIVQVVRDRSKSRTLLKLNVALKNCGARLSRGSRTKLANSIDMGVSRSTATRHYMAALDQEDRPWQYANLEHALRCGVPMTALNMMLSVMELHCAELYRKSVMCSPQSMLDWFMQPLAICMPLRGAYNYRPLASIEPALLLCFLAWQHLHNNDVDLSGLLALPITQKNKHMSFKFMKSLRIARQQMPVMPFVGIRADSRCIVLSSVLASLVQGIPLDKSRDSLDIHLVKQCITPYSRLSETACLDVNSNGVTSDDEADNDVWALFSLGTLLRGMVREDRSELLTCFDSFGKAAHSSLELKLDITGMLVCTTQRYLRDKCRRRVFSDLEQLGQQARTFQELLRKMHPLVARACLRVALCHTWTAFILASFSWAACRLLQDDRVAVFWKLRSASLRLCKLIRRLTIQCQQRLQQQRECSESSDSDSESNDSESSNSTTESTNTSTDSTDLSDSDIESSETDSVTDSDSLSTDSQCPSRRASYSIGPCPICLEDQYTDPVTLVACSHVFCRACIAEWASRGRMRCPMCNASLEEGARDSDHQRLALRL
ncbi:MAG: hypothetical protein MHM6MM_003032 [Cercozoa sp. M6MM]